MIAGKKFKKLDEEIKDMLINSELQIYELVDCTEKDVREIFRRQNAGKPLNKKNLRTVIENDELSEVIYKLTAMPIMKKICTKTQRKNATDRDIILQTLMLIESNQEKEYLSFRSKDIDNFILYYQESIPMSKIDILIDAMKWMDENYEEISLNISSIPLVLYAAYRVKKEKRSMAKFKEILDQFIADMSTESKLQEYKQTMTVRPTDKEKVKVRFDYWRSLIRSLQTA